MKETSDLFEELLAGDHRVETRIRFYTKENEWITNVYEDGLVSVKEKTKLFPGNALTVGNCVASQLDVKINKPAEAIPRNAMIALSVRVTDGQRYSEWIARGYYHIDTRKEEDAGNGRKLLTIRAYDRMLELEQDYPETKLNWPAKDIDVIAEICEHFGMNAPGWWITNWVNKGYMVNYPAQFSCREVLGYIAAMYGANCLLQNNETLAFMPIWFGTWNYRNTRTDITGKTASFQTTEAMPEYVRVELIVNDDSAYYAGAAEGKTLTVECPWGTQAMADNLLSQLKGFQYQPYKADVLKFDPVATISDGIIAGDLKSTVCELEINFGHNCRATVSAPWEEEPEHEYRHERKADRKIRRQLRGLTTELTIQAGLIQGEIADRINETDYLGSLITQNAEKITAKVSKTGGTPSSFSWELTDSSWKLKSKGTTVLSATASGVEVTGKITATSGKIGGFTIQNGYLSTNDQVWEDATRMVRSIDEEVEEIPEEVVGEVQDEGLYIGPYGIRLGKNFTVSASGAIKAVSGEIGGFTIKDNYLSTNGQTWGDVIKNGIYIGENGIQLGRNFKVDNSGDITAKSGIFSGTVYAGEIAYGNNGEGYLHGDGLDTFTVGGYDGNQILSMWSISTNNFNDGVNETLAVADQIAGMLSGAEGAETFSAMQMYTEELNVSENLYFGDHQLYLGSFPDRNGTIQRCVQWHAN